MSKAPLSGRLPVCLVLFGVEHFIYTAIHPAFPRRVCLVLDSVAFVLGLLRGRRCIVAMMIVVKRRERDAATILGAMVLSVTVITYLVRMAAHVGNYGELTNTMKDVAVARSSFAWQQVRHRGARPRSSLLPS
jgi:hypothetical protein